MTRGITVADRISTLLIRLYTHWLTWLSSHTKQSDLPFTPYTPAVVLTENEPVAIRLERTRVPAMSWNALGAKVVQTVAKGLPAWLLPQRISSMRSLAAP